MRQALFCLALVAFLASAFSSPTIGQQAPAGRQGGAPGGRQGGPPPVQLAEGAGREQVQATCTRCHGLNLIANSWGYTKDGWQDRIATMVKLPADRARNHLVVSGGALPDQGRSGRGADLGPGDRHDQGVARSHARLAAARLARRG